MITNPNQNLTRFRFLYFYVYGLLCIPGFAVCYGCMSVVYCVPHVYPMCCLLEVSYFLLNVYFVIFFAMLLHYSKLWHPKTILKLVLVFNNMILSIVWSVHSVIGSAEQSHCSSDQVLPGFKTVSSFAMTAKHPLHGIDITRSNTP